MLSLQLMSPTSLLRKETTSGVTIKGGPCASRFCLYSSYVSWTAISVVMSAIDVTTQCFLLQQASLWLPLPV